MSVHQQVYNDFVQSVSLGKKDNWLQESDMTQERFLKMMFVNYAPAYQSLCLTKAGFSILQTFYQVWKIPLDTSDAHKKFSGKVFVTLHRHMKVPYYLEPNTIYVFGSQAALELEMASRDIFTWAEMFS